MSNTGLGGRLHDDPRLMVMDHAVAANTKVRDPGLLSGRPEIPLPADASNTLFVEGLPSNCSRREVARILLFHLAYFLKLLMYRLYAGIHIFIFGLDP